MLKSTLRTDLWTPRSAAETREIYAQWAQSYDDNVQNAGYATPARIAAAISEFLPDRTAPILDFGCGTGLSGTALAARGFSTIDGTDITPEMLLHAEKTGAYRTLWVGTPGTPPAPGYRAITATGVISLGAAPPETLALLINVLGKGDLLALSYNDATLADKSFVQAMSDACAKSVRKLFEEYGDHLPAKNMGSTIYVLQKV